MALSYLDYEFESVHSYEVGKIGNRSSLRQRDEVDVDDSYSDVVNDMDVSYDCKFKFIF